MLHVAHVGLKHINHVHSRSFLCGSIFYALPVSFFEKWQRIIVSVCCEYRTVFGYSQSGVDNISITYYPAFCTIMLFIEKIQPASKCHKNIRQLDMIHVIFDISHDFISVIFVG